MQNDGRSVTVGELVDGHRLSATQIRTICLCAIAALLDGYDVQALGLAIPQMSSEFGVAPSAFGIAASASLVGMAIGAILLSSLADRFGRRPMIIATLVLIGSATAGALTSRNPTILAAWRFAAGLGLGALVPIAIAMTTECAPRKHRALLVTAVITCTGGGALVAGLIGPALDAHWGWRGIFAAGAVLPLLLAAVCWGALPESLSFLVARRPDGPALEKLVKAMAPSLSGVRLVPDPVLDGRAEAGGLRLKALFSIALRNRTVAIWTMFWLNLFANYSLISWLPTLLTQAQWSRASAIQATALLAIGGIIGSLGISAIVDRGRMTLVLSATYLAAAAVFLTFALAPPSQTLWRVLLVAVGLTAFGSQISIGSIAATAYPADIRSSAVGWASGVGRIGSFVGPLAIAALMQAGAPTSLSLALLGVPMLCCAASVAFLASSLRKGSAN